MNKENDNELVEATKRLKKAREKIIKNNQEAIEKEPKSLVSGHLDEVELKRREEREDEDE